MRENSRVETRRVDSGGGREGGGSWGSVWDERCKLPKRGRNRIWCILALKSDIRRMVATISIFVRINRPNSMIDMMSRYVVHTAWSIQYNSYLKKAVGQNYA